MASRMVELSVPELTDRADLVIEGEVVSTEHRSSQGGRLLFTVARVRPNEAWKGEAAEEIEVIVPGGAQGEYVQKVHGAASLQAGESVVLFLRRKGTLPLQVVGMAQGKFRIVSDGQGEPWVTQDLAGLELVPKGRTFQAQPLREAPRTLRELRGEVLRVAGGGGGRGGE